MGTALLARDTPHHLLAAGEFAYQSVDYDELGFKDSNCNLAARSGVTGDAPACLWGQPICASTRRSAGKIV